MKPWLALCIGLIATAVAAMALVACTPTRPSGSGAGPTSPIGLYFENRGGPAFEVSVNGITAVTVACDGGAILVPGENGVPTLPWALSVTRVRDQTVVYSGQVTSLPAWYVQIGESVLGVNYTPVSGPAGPSCSPS